MTETLPSKQKFDEYARLGLLVKRSHNTLPLSIYVYSPFASYEKLWNSVTLTARGIVFDDKDRCVVRCLPKFFNEEEPHALCGIDPKAKPTYFDKLDGSLIQVVNDSEYGLVVTSKGSFHSKQAKWARDYIALHYSVDDFKQGLTYVFELIHPNNRIVLDYGDMYEIFLLAVINTATGKESDIFADEYSIFKKVRVIKNINKHLNDSLVEGLVVKTGSHRYKVKTGEYIRLHRIITEFTPKRVWEALAQGKSLEFENMPEEFESWLETTKNEIQKAFDDIVADIHKEHEQTKHLTNKELGLTGGLNYKSYLYSIRTGKDFSELVWRRIKPKEGAL